ncbi:hypothetical protein [Paenibacillus sp. PL91]|uniref:hypothetical protein n=1 Tax=Paenibacillus sp. PL91 TaxID=2729538 RepID=UPI00145EDE04|nr:hypothetical protein [Paenibacillus sp. PL91]MBC9201050.1 hypothetical protein [Paenibacillus sp. PL91]
MAAERIVADFVGTTLSSYTPHGPRSEGPDLELVRWMSEALPLPFVAEGRIGTPEEAASAMRAGASYVGVGGAITRPQFIAEARDGLPASSVHSGSFILYRRKSTSRARCRANRNVLKSIVPASTPAAAPRLIEERDTRTSPLPLCWSYSSASYSRWSP